MIMRDSQAAATYEVVVWDFDGVLNRNIVDGRFIWADRFENDLGKPHAPFRDKVFGPGFPDVLCGRIDLLDLVAEWAADNGYSGTAQQVLDYWFAADEHLDPTILTIIEQLASSGIRNVVATNNDVRRAAYIEGEMEMGQRVERVFASGRIGTMKPDPRFFEHVRDSLGVPAERLFLVDDNKANIEAARGLGWQTHHFSPSGYRDLKAALGDGLEIR